MSCDSKTWDLREGDDVILAVAIHDGHWIRPEVATHMALTDADQLREEDPYTGRLARHIETHLIPCRSRFEVDLNRPPDSPVYKGPEQAWGLDLWARPLTPEIEAGSKAYYDAFYQAYAAQLDRLLKRHDSLLVLDLHSYNHQRKGPGARVDDPIANPEVNLGTGTLDRDRFGALAECFKAEMRQVSIEGRELDVRENVKFKGGHLSRWTHASYPGRVAVLAVEFKKIFMNEWSGELEDRIFAALEAGLVASLPALRDVLRQSS